MGALIRGDPAAPLLSMNMQMRGLSYSAIDKSLANLDCGHSCLPGPGRILHPFEYHDGQGWQHRQRDDRSIENAKHNNYTNAAIEFGTRTPGSGTAASDRKLS